MSNINLQGDISTAINGSRDRGEPVVVAYVDPNGYPTTSFRGSLYVRNETQLAFWSRTSDDGLVASVGDRPKVTLLYLGFESDGAKMLSIQGEAKVDPSANDEVYAAIIEGEREHDPERKGVAVIIDVNSVSGYGADVTPLSQTA